MVGGTDSDFAVLGQALSSEYSLNDGMLKLAQGKASVFLFLGDVAPADGDYSKSICINYSAFLPNFGKNFRLAQYVERLLIASGAKATMSPHLSNMP